MKRIAVVILFVLVGICVAAEFRAPSSVEDVMEGGDSNRMQSAAARLTPTELSAPDRYGRTPLEMAAWTGNIQAMELLLSRGVNPEVGDERGYRPICCAATRGDVAAMRVLLQAGANVNCKDKAGRTPLHDAIACMGMPESVAFLLDHSADPNAVALDGWTPLHQAAVRGDLKVVQLLLKAGAKTQARDVEGRTALNEAWHAHQWRVVHILRHGQFAMARLQSSPSPPPGSVE